MNDKDFSMAVVGLSVGLAIFGLGALGLVAFLQWKIAHHIVYGIIYFIFMMLIGICLLPGFKLHRMYKKEERDREAEAIINKLKGINPNLTSWPGPR